MELKKTFLGGKMNKDLDQRLLSGGQYSDALNISIDTSEGSNIGSISNSLGNIKIGDVQALLSGYVPAINTLNSRVIGAIAYEPPYLSIMRLTILPHRYCFLPKLEVTLVS
jgi:hypothetical protein